MISVGRVIQVAVFAGFGLVLGACGTQPEKEPEPQTRAEPEPPKAPPITAEQRRQKLVAGLMDQATQAFREDRLTTPENDNAYDRFQSVLMLDPQHSGARAGIQAILIRYAEWARRAIREQDYAGARHHLQQARQYFPDNPLLEEISNTLAEDRRQVQEQEARQLAEAPEDKRTEYALPSLALSNRTEAIAEYLGRIARRLAETQESVMIYARSDAEGRWIYQQMNKAVPDYRVRGDIRLDNKPRVVLLPPLG